MNDTMNTDTIVLSSENKPISNNYAEELFFKGLFCIYKNDLTEAKLFLSRALKQTDELDILYWQCASFLGLVEVFVLKSNGGLHRCYQASNKHPVNAEFHLNVAYAEHILGNRKRCVSSLEKCLKISPDHAMANLFFDGIGRRTRKNSIKNAIGKFLRKKNRLNKESTAEMIKNYLIPKLDNHVKEMRYHPS